MNIEEKMLSSKDLTYRPKKNNSYIIANAILESICYHNKINEPLRVADFKESDFYNWMDEEEDIRKIFKSSENILKESMRVIKVLDLLKYKRPKYTLSTEKWFEDRNFSINDNIVLKELMPILLYYVGKCDEGSYTLFFEKLDFLIEYIIKPALEHNESFEKERHVIDCINELEEVTILNENNDEVSVVAISIKLEKESSNKVKKILVYESLDLSHKEVSIDKVVIKGTTTFKENITNYNTNLTMLKSYTNLQSEIQPDDKKNLEFILECDTVLYEYFQIKPLNNMKIFDTEEKLEEYGRTYELKSNKDVKNVFYVVGNDSKEMIISTVLHSMPHARILKPANLNDDIINTFETYFDKLNIDPCKKESPKNDNGDEPSDNPPSDGGVSSPVSSNTVKKSKNSNAEINKMLNRWAEDDLKNNTFLP